MTTNKFRSSYSVLSMWARGDWQNALALYFKLPTPVTKAMDAGKQWHRHWAMHTEATKRLPKEFGDKPLINPKTDLKLECSLTEWLDLVGVIDCLDGKTIYEYKTGANRVNLKETGNQCAIYGVLAIMNDIKVEQGRIWHFNQHTNRSYLDIVWLSEKRLKDSLNWVESIASEMFDYIQKNNLEEKLRKGKL